jgi:hypothetical protein
MFYGRNKVKSRHTLKKILVIDFYTYPGPTSLSLLSHFVTLPNVYPLRTGYATNKAWTNIASTRKYIVLRE